MEDAELNYILEQTLENDMKIEDLLFQMSYMDFSEDHLSSRLFSKIIDSWFSFPVVQSTENQLLILEVLVKNGLDFNVYPYATDGMSFSYGHMVMRNSKHELISFVLNHGFNFNSYTENKWHSLELLTMNYMSPTEYKQDILNIIKSQLEKDIDLSETDAKDFFTKINFRKKNKGWIELLDVFKNNDYMVSYITDNIHIILNIGIKELIPKEIDDIFVF